MKNSQQTHSIDWHQLAFYRVSAIGVIRSKSGQVLMVNEHGRYTLPGGGWDYGESLHACLVRELHEEIALTTPFHEHVVGALPFYNPNKAAWQMWVGCIIDYDELEFGVGESAADVQWFDRADITDATLAGQLSRQLLELIDEQEKSYCRRQPDKYPEVASEE